MKRTFSILIAALMIAGCAGHNGKSAFSAKNLSTQKARQFVDFLVTLNTKPLDQAQDSMRAWFLRYEQDSLMVSTVSTYLYDTESPYRNEELYLPFVQGLATSEFTPDSLREAYADDALMCSINRIGESARDFDMETLDGQTLHLYGVKAEYTLLLFSHPECRACEDVTDILMSDKHLLGLTETGKMAVVNMFIDEDLDLWREYAPTYPESWFNCFDPVPVIRENRLYNVRAIPTLYILDKDKKVILKDAPFETINAFIHEKIR